MSDGIIRFDGCDDAHNFFEKQALERLDKYYKDYDSEKFSKIIEQRALWEMDEANKRVGIAKKFWWEGHIGKIAGKSILEVGCGVNYIVPYFLLSGNRVTAFDICEESVVYSRRIAEAAGAPIDRVQYAVADAERARFGKKFDFVNVSNVLHHVNDKMAALRRIHDSLSDDGMLLIVEPNYYYPPRWIVETDVLDPFNFIKEYFVRNDLLEKGEKAVVFSTLIRQLHDAGFELEFYEKDINYLGYFTVYWMKERRAVARVIHEIDRLILSKILPRKWAPFEYVIARKIGIDSVV